MIREEKEKKLADIAEKVAKCTACSLYKQTTNPVPGEGNPEARIMFIGEGPGFNEDQQGRPFVGQAGKLLEQLLRLIKLERQDVWIGNVVKHRPPGNREPQPAEIEACRPFLDQQIKIINPEIIVTLGRFSMEKFFPNERISQIHGRARYVDLAGERKTVIPMYHPAAALRNSAILEQIKKDFEKIPVFLSDQEVAEPVLPQEKQEEKKEKQMKLF